MAKLGGVYIGVRARTDKYKRDLANAKTMTERSALRINHAISKISFAQVGVAALAFGAIMGKVALDGLKAVEQMKLSTSSLASTITSFAKNAETDLAGTYKQAYDYSGQIVLKMEELNAKTVATGANLTAMVETLAQGGVLLDLNNKEQEKGFLAIANALALITQGQNQDIQFRQEIRGLIQGEVRATNLLSRLLSQRVGGELKKHVTLWKEQGTLIENAGALLAGFQEGAKDLQNTWIAVGTTLKTMYDRTMRGLMLPIYNDIINAGKQITLNALDQNSALNQNATLLKTVIYKGWLDIKNITQSIADIIAAFKDPLLLIGKITGMILDGWGQIFAILPAITKRFKLITQAVFDSVKMIGHFGAALWKAASLDFKGAAEQLTLAKNDWIESGRKTGEAFGSGFINELDKRLFEYNKNLQGLGGGTATAPELKPTPKTTDLDKELKALQEANQKKYAMDIALAELTQQDTWMIKKAGMDAAILQQEDDQTRQTQAEYDALQERLKIQEEFNLRSQEMGLNEFDLEREQVERMMEIYREAGVDKIALAKMTAQRLKDISNAEKEQKISDMRDVVSDMSQGFKEISEMGGKHSKEAFAMYKAFKIVETVMNTRTAAMGAYAALAGIPYIGPALGIAAAGAAIAFGAAQVSMIANAQPPSYDQGGISNARGIYQTGNISEAHIPIPSGGKIPVKMDGGGNQQQPVNIIMNNPVFQDLNTQRQAMAQIAEIVAERVAPGAVVRNYNNDGAVRNMVRQGA